MKRTDSTTTRPITLRLTLFQPPTGVPWAVQLGRVELLSPTSVTRDHVVFEIPLDLSTSSAGEVRLRGAAVQGPSGARFLYVTSGSRAGALGSAWDRRAKVPLVSVPLEDLGRTPIDQPLVLHGEIAGTAKDGGPACASVPLIRGGWSFSPRTG